MLRVCYFGTYRQEYSRNQIMIKGLRHNQVEVIECHVQLWHSIEERVNTVTEGWKNPHFWWRVIRAYLTLLKQFVRLEGNYDLMVVGYPGQFDVYLARLLTWWQRKPLVWDVFMSIYLIALERKLDRQAPLMLALLRRIEQVACHLPDQLIIDTEAYAQWLATTHHLSPARFALVPTGADSQTFQPRPSTTPTGASAKPEICTVLYYGTFIPNHGVLTMIEAAQRLRNQTKIRFEFVGEGPDKALAEERVRREGLEQVSFISWLTQAELVQKIADADICLGAFGTTPQSLMTVQNKIYECLAMERAVISGDSPTVRKALQQGKEIYLCERQNPEALAQAIRTLANDAALRAQIAQQGRKRFEAEFSIEQLGARFRQHLEKVITA